MVRLNWVLNANNDLKDIFEYISIDSKRFAELQIKRIYKRTQILKLQPKAGRIVPEIERENIRELVEGNYRIVYRIKSESEVDILLVHHVARDLTRRI